MGEWSGGLASWDVFSTLTFSRPVNLQRAMCMARQYLRWVNKAAGLPVYGFVGVEKGNMLHLHALLGNVAHLLTYCGKRLAPGVWGQGCCLPHGWPCGIARVLPYDPARGASYYVAKCMWELFGFPCATQFALVGRPGGTRVHPVFRRCPSRIV
jgi:hypothetical protein